MNRKQWPNRALGGGAPLPGRAVLGVHTYQCCYIPIHPSLTRTEGTVHPTLVEWNVPTAAGGWTQASDYRWGLGVACGVPLGSLGP